jgi:UDP-N-acetylglucosamine acyltransferase
MIKEQEVSIHSTAIVHPKAQIAEGVEIGPYSVIGEHVSIGKDTKIASHVLIEGWTTIGERNEIYSFSSIGTPPQDTGYKGQETSVVIGNDNIIREFATIHRATVKEDRVTSIGDRNFLMAYIHVAHDCKLGNNIIMANNAAFGGHVIVEDHAVLGAIVGIHQFVRVGAYSMIGGQSAVVLDVPPYMNATGNRAQLYGLNLVGLKRKGFSEQAISNLKKTYKIIFRSGLTQEDAFKRALAEFPDTKEVGYLVNFMSSSRRGVTR